MTPHEAGDSARVTAWFDPGRVRVQAVKRGKLLFKHHITVTDRLRKLVIMHTVQYGYGS